MAAPTAEDRARETKGLRGSMAMTAALGLVGVTWGLVAGSQMILFDGVYAVFGIATTALLMRASFLATTEPTRRFPFGREAVTPLAIGIQGLVLTGTLAYAALEAGFALLQGGSEVAALSGIAYSVLVTAASVVVWRLLVRRSGTSDVLGAESTAWRISALQGVGMIVGFTILLAITGSPLDRFAPYVDPVMVLITCAVFLPVTLRMIRSTTIELLEGAPPPPVAAALDAALAPIKVGFRLQDIEVRSSKVGPKLYLEVEAFTDPTVTVEQVEQLRASITAETERLPYDLWLNLDIRPLHPSDTLASGDVQRSVAVV